MIFLDWVSEMMIELTELNSSELLTMFDTYDQGLLCKWTLEGFVTTDVEISPGKRIFHFRKDIKIEKLFLLESLLFSPQNVCTIHFGFFPQLLLYKGDYVKVKCILRSDEDADGNRVITIESSGRDSIEITYVMAG